MFSIASIATMAVCIFIFGVFSSILLNVDSMVRSLEEQVAITVLFDEGTDEAAHQAIGTQIGALEHVTETTYTSAEEAWEEFKEVYLGNNTELADGFQDNPLANSASFTVKVDEIENQSGVVAQIEQMDGVRQVNQSSKAVENLQDLNRLITAVSAVVVLILLVVSVILISNTINVGISVRKDEIAIMKLIGAKDSFVRAPFIVEGLILGVIGAAIPLIALYFGYGQLMNTLMQRFGFMSIMAGMLPSIQYVFRYVVPVSLMLGIGIGLLGSIITVKRHLKV